ADRGAMRRRQIGHRGERVGERHPVLERALDRTEPRALLGLAQRTDRGHERQSTALRRRERSVEGHALRSRSCAESEHGPAGSSKETGSFSPADTFSPGFTIATFAACGRGPKRRDASGEGFFLLLPTRRTEERENFGLSRGFCDVTCYDL